MALVDPKPEEEGEPVPTSVTVQLDADAHELLTELMARTGLDASELFGWALGAYWRDMEGIVLPPMPVEDVSRVECPEGDFRRHFTPQQVASIERGLADIAAGRVVDHDELFDRLAAKYDG